MFILGNAMCSPMCSPNTGVNNLGGYSKNSDQVGQVTTSANSLKLYILAKNSNEKASTDKLKRHKNVSWRRINYLI